MHRFSIPVTPMRMPSFIGVLATMGIIGCGSRGVVPIQPQFLLDGKPLQEASVSFIRTGVEEGRPAFGITDSNGVATLTTYEPLDGVLPGNYAVVVIKAPENAMTYTAEDADTSNIKDLVRMSTMGDAKPSRVKRVRSTIPEIYSDPGTTPLKCQVTPDVIEYQFELASAK